MVNALELNTDTFIAFPYSYDNDPNDLSIEVARITKVYPEDQKVLVHFLYGYKSMGEFIPYTDIVAIGDHVNGTHGIKGWSGKFRLILPENETLKQNLKPDGVY
jgi:hypothetical protein